MLTEPSPSRPNLGLAVTELATLRAKAQELETVFLAEMLSYSGLESDSGSFGGGIGEDQFGSFLREAQASAMVKAGGVGLAESIFRSLTDGRDG